MPLKVEQINNGLFLDNVPRKKKIKVAVNDVIINDCEYDYKTIMAPMYAVNLQTVVPL